MHNDASFFNRVFFAFLDKDHFKFKSHFFSALFRIYFMLCFYMADFGRSYCILVVSHIQSEYMNCKILKEPSAG